VLQHDFNNGIWAVLSDDESTLDCHRFCPAFCLFNDCFYLFGGMVIHNGTVLTNSVCLFDLISKQWHEVPSNACRPEDLPIPRFKSSATVYDGRMIVYGGYGNPQAQLSVDSKPEWFLNEVLEYDFTSTRWRRIEINGISQPLGRSRFAMSRMMNNNSSLLIVGGMVEHDRRTNETWIFNIRNRRWNQVDAPGVPPLSAHTLVSDGSARYILFGGSDHEHGIPGHATNRMFSLYIDPAISLTQLVCEYIVQHGIQYS
jgi:N-acetylneuraminic acid mutarotase